MKTDPESNPYVLQLCHSYEPPFESVARQYEAFFEGTCFQVITAYLKGAPDADVIKRSRAEAVVFFQNTSRSLRGSKRQQIGQVRQLQRRYGFKFCIAHRYKAIYIASHMQGLTVLGVHHIDGVYRPWTRRCYVNRKRGQLVLLGVSRAVCDDLRQSLPRFPKERTGYVYNSLDFARIRTQQFDRKEARMRLGLTETGFVFGTIGRLHPDKDHRTLVLAFSRMAADVPEARLVIIGDGPLRGELEKLVQGLSLEGRVTFLGWVDEAYRYVKAFDAFILSSIREGLPVALLEAFAGKVICAASRCRGNAEAIEDAGYGFDVGDVEELSRLMMNIYRMDDREKEEWHRRMGLKIDSHFTVDAARRSFWNAPWLKYAVG